MAKGKKAPQGTLKKVLLHIKKYSPFLLLSVIFAAASSIAMLYIPILVGDAVDLIVSKGNVDFKGVLKIAGEIGAIAAASDFIQCLMNVIIIRITYHVVRDLREEAF